MFQLMKQERTIKQPNNQNNNININCYMPIILQIETGRKWYLNLRNKSQYRNRKTDSKNSNLGLLKYGI